MSITVFNTNPQRLLLTIKKAIDDGEVETWSYDSENYFTHTPDQWRNKAWFKPLIGLDTLQFGLYGQQHVVMTKPIYGVYHGRFIEMLLTHFDLSFSSVASTALGNIPVDNFKPGS